MGAAHSQRLAMHIVQRNEQRLYPRIDGIAGVGETQMPRGALDQPQPEIVFQSLPAALKVDLGWPSTRAAALKPPCCTTSQNSSQSRQSIPLSMGRYRVSRQSGYPSPRRCHRR